MRGSILSTLGTTAAINRPHTDTALCLSSAFVLKCCYISLNNVSWIISHCDPDTELDDFSMTLIHKSQHFHGLEVLFFLGPLMLFSSSKKKKAITGQKRGHALLVHWRKAAENSNVMCKSNASLMCEIIRDILMKWSIWTLPDTSWIPQRLSGELEYS